MHHGVYGRKLDGGTKVKISRRVVGPPDHGNCVIGRKDVPSTLSVNKKNPLEEPNTQTEGDIFGLRKIRSEGKVNSYLYTGPESVSRRGRVLNVSLRSLTFVVHGTS